MTEFCTQVHGGKSYQITVKTDNKEHYLRIQQAARECVDNATAIDAEPVKHGEWQEIRNAYGELEGWLCECGREVKCKEKFCPNCGAKMDGGE